MEINKDWIKEIDRIIEENNLPLFDLFSEETIEFFNKSASTQERLYYINSFPFFKIKEIVLNVANEKENIENLPLLLRQKLKITTEQAEKISQEIKERIFLIKTENGRNKKKSQITHEERKEKRIDPYREPL
ncbi:MAG: hypothetical protein ACPLZH_00470 [Minisyncoccales bacterium]